MGNGSIPTKKRLWEDPETYISFTVDVGLGLGNMFVGKLFILHGEDKLFGIPLGVFVLRLGISSLERMEMVQSM